MSAPGRLANDCFAAIAEMMTHDQALAQLKERLRPVVGAETVPLAAAAGRTLAEDVIAPRDIPAFDNAAMDGIAVRHADLDPDTETVLPVAFTVMAGDVPRPLPAEAAARIFTGAPMPQGADTCLMQEDLMFEGGKVRIPPGASQGINVRPAGEDQKRGQPVARAGRRLRAPELAAIASTGAAGARVFRRLKVALLSSGDEIIRPGEAWREGAIYDANHYILAATLAGMGAEVIDGGIVADDRQAVQRAYERAADQADVIVTSAGASEGRADYMAETVREMGRLHAWKLAIKPGKPIAFGQIGDTVFLGLPGNPVAAFVTFLIYGWPMINRLAGHEWAEAPRYELEAGFSFTRRKQGRREFLRGWLEREEETGRMVVRRYPLSGSGLISSAVAATGLVEVTEDVQRIGPGDMVRFIPFAECGVGYK